MKLIQVTQVFDDHSTRDTRINPFQVAYVEQDGDAAMIYFIGSGYINVSNSFNEVLTVLMDVD